MGRDIIVFLGPTLAQGEASAYLSAEYLPPAEQGSVFRAVQSFNPRAIVLIDGAFAKVPAVRHKEILWTLSQGIPVYGAGSMGALRAAELAPFGMCGSGLVYRWYRATPLVDDDEVAVAMTPSELGAQALSEALINIRLTLRRAERSGILSGQARRALDRLAYGMHFVERTYPTLFDNARAVLPRRWRSQVDTTERWATTHAVDQKKADTVALLCRLAGNRGMSPVEPLAPFRLTEAWAADLDAAGLEPDDLLSQHARRA